MKLTSDRHYGDEPHTRLTRLADAAIKAVENHPEHADDLRVIILISDEQRGGMVLHGYEDHAEAIADLLGHTEAGAAMVGVDLRIIPTGPIGEG